LAPWSLRRKGKVKSLGSTIEFSKMKPLKVAHAIGKSPHPRKDQLVSVLYPFRVPGYYGLGTHVLQGLLDAPQVSPLVIHHRYQVQRTPLVDGMSPSPTLTACLRARAKALKMASMAWWELSPFRRRMWRVILDPLTTP
jgi:hypothetical protein